jgi:hypothetical protein
LAIGLGTASASSVSIAAAGNSEAGSVGVGQGLGTDGYLFFPSVGQSSYSSAFGADAYVQPAYVGGISPASGNQDYGGGTGTTGPTMTAFTASASNTFHVGEEYQTEGSASLTTLVSFTLSGSVPQEFQLGVLGDTYGNNRFNTYTVSDGTAATATQVDARVDATNLIDTTQFYYFDISNASAGDTISIAALPTGSGGDLDPMLSGITFDTISAAPEPASLSILAFGAVGLLSRRRRDMKKEQKPLL